MFAVIPMLHYAAAHGVSTELPLRFGRLDDVSLSKQSIQTGETITITGKIVYMVQKHTQGWLTIHYDPGPYGRWSTISTQPSEHLIDIPGNSLIPFSITIKAFQPGIYHFFPEVYLVGIGPAMSSLDGNIRTEPTVVVTGNPICKEGLVAISKTENGSTACIKPETAQKLVGRGWGTFAPSSVDSTDNQTSSALKLLMSTDSDIIQPGKSIGITISVNNTLATPVDVPAQNNWSYPNVSTGPCQKINYGISILDGFYDKNNLTQGKSLNLFNSGIILCPNIQETAKMYEFQPSSGDVKQVQCKSIEGFQCETGSYQMGQNYKFDDYSDQGIVQPFKSGIYTLVGADEWGHVAIQHFVVTNSTIFAGDLGSMSCPAIFGGMQFGATIKNSTGFANYYNSTQYDHTFFLHPKMQGTINVQYTSPVNAAWFQNNNNAPFNMTNGASSFLYGKCNQCQSNNIIRCFTLQ